MSNQTRTTALLPHLEPSYQMLDVGTTAILNCGCGATFYADRNDPEAPNGEFWTLVRQRHADHVRTVAEGLLLAESAGPEDGPETAAVPSLGEDEENGIDLTGDLISDFARSHGLRPDWHEPDEQGVGARVIGTHLDNAHGDMAGRMVSKDGVDFSEFNVVLTVENDEGVPEDAAVVNLASLLAIAARRG